MSTENMEANLITNEKKSIYRSPIGSIFNKFAGQKDVSLVYGEPVELENKRVLPVAKVDYFVGGGGGYAGGSETESAGQGEGGGGYISVKPLGVYEITTESVKFKPVIDLKFMVTIYTVLLLGLALLLKKPRKNK